MNTMLRRTSSDLASMSRAAQRKERLLQIENEQRIEEAEALKMTEEQRETLLRSFTSVKVEFSDLDGLQWTHSALKRRQNIPHPKSPGSPTPPNHAFVILTNADLATFSPEDTIRASAARPRPRFPSHSSPNLSRGPPAGSPTSSRSPMNSLFSGAGSSPKLPGHHPRHKESRRSSYAETCPPSTASGYESDCDRTVRGGSDVDSDDEYESSSGSVERGRGKGKRVARKGKRRIRRSMAGDDGLVNDADADEGAEGDIMGGAKVPQPSAPKLIDLKPHSTLMAGVQSSASLPGDISSLRDVSAPMDSASPAAPTPVLPSKAPAFITYSSPSPAPRTITYSSTNPAVAPFVSPISPSNSSTTLPGTPLPDVAHPPSAELMQSSTSLPALRSISPAPPHSLFPTHSVLSAPSHISDAPPPLTRLPHRIRRTRSSSSSPLPSHSSPPLTSLPFPLSSTTPAPLPIVTPASPEVRVAPPHTTSELLYESATCSASPLASPPLPTSLLLQSRPESTTSSPPRSLVVHGWSPHLNDEQDARVDGSATDTGPLLDTAAKLRTSDRASEATSLLAP